jgi:hypothetical protein
MHPFRLIAACGAVIFAVAVAGCNGSGAGEAQPGGTEEVAGRWQTMTIENDAGPYSSLAVDQQFVPHVACYLTTGGNLAYGAWTGSVWAGKANPGGPDQVDSFQTGRYPSLALDQDEYPLIAYHDWGHGHLMFSRWDGSAWRGFVTAEGPDTVDTGTSYVGETVGQETSIAVDGNGYPHIVYYDEAEEDVKYVRWSGSSWRGLARGNRPDSVDSDTAIDDRRPAIALDADGYPHVSYCNWTDGDLRYVRWSGSDWVGLADTNAPDTIDGAASSAGHSSSIAIDSQGYPHIAYQAASGTATAKYARWNGSAWVGLTSDTGPEIVPGTTFASDVDLALDSEDRPHIAYYDVDLHCLKYVRWNGDAWMGLADTTAPDIVDLAADVGTFPSLVLDKDDNPHISYWDYTNMAIKYAHIGSER